MCWLCSDRKTEPNGCWRSSTSLGGTGWTVLLAEEAPGWGSDESEAGVARRDRLAALLGAIEHWTGATVVGLAGEPDQLRGWRFDRIVRAEAFAPLAA